MKDVGGRRLCWKFAAVAWSGEKGGFGCGRPSVAALVLRDVGLY